MRKKELKQLYYGLLEEQISPELISKNVFFAHCVNLKHESLIDVAVKLNVINNGKYTEHNKLVA